MSARGRKYTARRPRPPQAAVNDTPSSSRRDHWIGLVAGGAVLALAFVFGFHKIDDFDTWWHLAAGRWIAEHGTVPSADTLSHTVRSHEWINLQWGFDLGLYLVHRVGGPGLLVLAGALTFVAAAALTLRTVRVAVGPGMGSLLMIPVLLAAQERVTLRPELVSFALLAAVLTVLDLGRRLGQWWIALVPLMLIWVNVHALFIVGAFAIVCASLSIRNRRLWMWSAVALGATMVNPYGLRGVLFPLELWSRLDGSAAVFGTIGEFASPFAGASTDVSIVAYYVLLGLTGLVAATAMVRSRSEVGSFDRGGLLFVAGLAVLSGTSRRNVALFAIGATPFVARWMSQARWSWLHRPGAESVTGPTATAIAVLLVALVATGGFYRFTRSPQEFGVGVIEGTFPERAAAFAREAGLPGPLYNDMAAGGYLAWANPTGTGIFVDGRLEVYDAPFLTTYLAAQNEPGRWQAEADRYGVQTAIIFHRFENELGLIGHLVRNPSWSLVYGDEAAAVFVRTSGNEPAIANAARSKPEWDRRTEAWLSGPVGRWPYPAGRVEGTRAYARFLATLGRADEAIAAYLKLFELGIPASEEIERRLLIARYYAGNGRADLARQHALEVLELQPANAEAQRYVR